MRGRYGVSRLEWRLVAALVESGPMSPSALTERAGLDPGRVSHALRRLAAKALVERHVAGTDRRRAIVAATPSGHRLYESLWPELSGDQPAADERALTTMAEVLDRCLRKLTDLAQAIHDDGGGVDVRTDRRLGGSRRFWSSAIE